MEKNARFLLIAQVLIVVMLMSVLGYLAMENANLRQDFRELKSTIESEPQNKVSLIIDDYRICTKVEHPARCFDISIGNSGDSSIGPNSLYIYGRSYGRNNEVLDVVEQEVSEMVGSESSVQLQYRSLIVPESAPGSDPDTPIGRIEVFLFFNGQEVESWEQDAYPDY